MDDSFLDNAGGYTPVPDKLVREYDFTTAYVWGKVWRYCQMANGACTASHETIANRAGMSRRTLIEKLNILIEAGYIEDKTPGLKNKPHTYCTKIGEAKITSTMQISHTESDNPTEIHKDLGSESDVSMRTLHSDDADNAQSDSPTMQNLHSESAKGAQSAQAAMQNLHLKKQESSSLESYPNKESLQDSSPYGEGGKPPPIQESGQKLKQVEPEVEKPPPRTEYTPFMREFLTAFSAKRFRNDTQAKTIAGLTAQFGEPKLRELIEWAANKGMGLGDAVASINSALTKPKPTKNGANNYGSHQRSNEKPTGESLKGQPTYDKYTKELVYPDGHREPAITDTG